jgi:hypothetical protein
MKGKHKIGTLEIDQIIKIERKASREIELMNATGWTATHKVHKSSKEYTRKDKHKKRWDD